MELKSSKNGFSGISNINSTLNHGSMPAVIHTYIQCVYKCVHILVGGSPNIFFPNFILQNIKLRMRENVCICMCACVHASTHMHTHQWALYHSGGQESILESETWVQILVPLHAYYTS